MERCGSWPVPQRRMAWIVRFRQWIANGRVASSTGLLTLEDLSQSTQAIVRNVQNECFPEDVKEVSQNKEVKISSRLGSLRPVLEDGVLRVGGRLQKAVVLSWDEKHEILPKHHHVSQLIVSFYHEFAAHSGREQTLCELQRMFWIISGRSLVKKIIRSCIKCRRMNAKPMEQFIGSLPEQGWKRTNLHLPLLVLTYLGH